jgi:hypothetical protein
MELPEPGDYVFPGGLAPLGAVAEGVGRYWEPNVGCSTKRPPAGRSLQAVLAQRADAQAPPLALIKQHRQRAHRRLRRAGR